MALMITDFWWPRCRWRLKEEKSSLPRSAHCAFEYLKKSIELHLWTPPPKVVGLSVAQSVMSESIGVRWVQRVWDLFDTLYRSILWEGSSLQIPKRSRQISTWSLCSNSILFICRLGLLRPATFPFSPRGNPLRWSIPVLSLKFTLIFLARGAWHRSAFFAGSGHSALCRTGLCKNSTANRPRVWKSAQFLQKFQNNQNADVQSTYLKHWCSVYGQKGGPLESHCHFIAKHPVIPLAAWGSAARNTEANSCQGAKARTASDRIKLKGVAGLSVLQGVAIFVLSISHVGSCGLRMIFSGPACLQLWLEPGSFFCVTGMAKLAMLCWILLILPLSFLAEWKGTPSIWIQFLGWPVGTWKGVVGAVFCALQSWYATTKSIQNAEKLRFDWGFMKVHEVW